MLISRISEETGGGEGRAGVSEVNARSPGYRTASELFELMTKNSHFQLHDDDSLTTRDLVLLYKNLDVGTKLMNDANGNKLNEVVKKRPNQYVETVVYNDESDSDLGENYSNEDLQNVFVFNQDGSFLNDKSFENLLCHKLGGVKINSSSLSTDYDKNFLFKDPYIKKQLKHLNLMSSCSEFNNVFSTSLIDYICCKRLEDNYNFYMDNIIRYVQHTIDQLKRISNGDYLTEKAKEKWREVISKDQEENTKVLAMSTSIPLHVECKSVGNATWDDIVHSEVDVRSLSKILEKKIVVEIPKLICGSYKLYSKRCADNLIISCQRDVEAIEKRKESRVDVVLQLKRSQTGQVMSNISSIMVLQTSQNLPDLQNLLPMPYKEEIDCSEDNINEPAVTVMEIDKETDSTTINVSCANKTVSGSEQITDDERHLNSFVETNDYPCSDYEKNDTIDASNQYSSGSNLTLRDILNKPIFPFRNEATYNLISPDELRITMQRLHKQSSLLEENIEDAPLRNAQRKKSAVRVRIKSPYENKSYLLEEKKRKRLLEIRERREKRKLALGESCKISKHKYGKVAIMPQASNSVTKLSITNKSFYNSIYGNTINIENKFMKARNRREQKPFSTSAATTSESNREAYFESPMTSPDKNSKKYINRSYYLDDADTEIMYTQIKQKDKEDTRNPYSGSTSVASNDFNTGVNLFSQLIESNDSNVEQNNIEDNPHKLFDVTCVITNTFKSPVMDIYTVPENSPHIAASSVANESQKNVFSIECRKSIDKLYQLMKKNLNGQSDDKLSQCKATPTYENNEGAGGCSTIQGSDSGTSVKHHTASSIPSSYSFDKKTTTIVKPKLVTKKNDQSTVVSKVLISSKQQTTPNCKPEMDKSRNNRRRPLEGPVSRAQPENPLKAISQLIHEFDNVQKSRHKNEIRPLKKTETPVIDKSLTRQGSFRRRSRFDQHTKDNEQEKKISPNVTPKEKRSKPMSPMELARIPHQPVIEDRTAKKKVADIIDEAKEARGEAVRGPSKFSSRLNTLAQPKRSYVQAHSEEYNNKYGRTVMADRLQRLAASAAPPPTTERNIGSANKIKANRPRADNTSTVSVKQLTPPVPHLDNYSRLRRSASSSPNRKPHHIPVGFHNSGPIYEAKMQSHEAIKKMVAVESYVKSHYGSSRANSPGDSKRVLLSGNKSRVPLIPADFELASLTSSPTAEEATEIGNKLHRMIDSMIKNAPPLTALPESDRESNSKTSKTTDFYADKIYQDQRTESNYRIDVFEDASLETAVESINNNTNRCSEVSVAISGSKLDLQPGNSRLEMERLESALCNQISGPFQKRLRIKKLTLTPKHSIQQVFFVQSGDAGSVVVQSPVLNLKTNDVSVKNMTVLSNTQLDWKFAQIPMQIATVGYAFPKHYNSQCSISSNIKFIEVSSTDSSKEASKMSNAAIFAGRSDKVSQCFKGIPQEQSLDMGAQADAADKCFLLSRVVSLNSTTVSQIPIENVPETDPKKCDDSQKDVICNNKTETTKFLHDKGSTNDIKSVTVIYTNNDTVETQLAHNESGNINDSKSGIKDSKNSSKLSSNVEEVDYTTSLDLLVGILNEIQKITFQNQISTSNNNHRIFDELENVINNASNSAKVDTTPGPIAALNSDKLRQRISNVNIYSLSKTSDDTSNVDVTTTSPPETLKNGGSSIKINDINNYDNDLERDVRDKVDDNAGNKKVKPFCVDKDVSANLTQKEYISTFTNVPSSLVSLTVNRGANITNSVVDVISEPSTHSLLKCTDYQTIYSDSQFDAQSIKKIIELPVESLVNQPVLVSRVKADLNMNEKLKSFNDLRKYCVDKSIIDPMLKVKRDILVTLYSILVLTVFAALSFPDLVNYDV